MNRLLLTAALTLLVLAPATNASAQLVAAKDGPIVYGHHHVNATSVDEHMKFWVDALGGVKTTFGANKLEIRQAVERLFSVKVKSVNTLTVKAKWKIRGRSIGRTQEWKKAMVVLQEGQTIEVL